MKQYPKVYEDISRKPSENVLNSIGSSLGSVDELASSFRTFYKEAHLVLFNFIVKQIWLEQHFLYNGSRRGSRSSNGFTTDWAFAYFMKSIVGISQKPLTDGLIFVAIPTYFADFFPNFSDYNPFVEPEYFKYPYKHLTLDHLSFVYHCHDRLEILEEAERRSMKIGDFVNWASNHALSSLDEEGGQMYDICRYDFAPFVRRLNKKKKYGK